MSNYSKTIVVGRAGSSPDGRYLADGRMVCNLSVATQVGFGEKRYTMWYRVSLFGKLAEFAVANVKKGARLLIEGVLQGDPVTGGPRIYQKNDGSAGASFEMYADELRVIDWEEKPGDNGNGNGEA